MFGGFCLVSIIALCMVGVLVLILMHVMYFSCI